MCSRSAALAALTLLACGEADGDPGPAADRATPAASDAAPSDAAAPDAAPLDGPPVSTPDAAADDCLATLVRVGDFEIFAYEASQGDDGRACSRPDALPWGDLDLEAARAACVASGFALCTGDQWLLACGGEAHRPFPYGAEHRDGVCNDHVSGSAMREAGGARPDCHTPEGVFDLSGNLAEMADDATKRGGSFRVNAVQYQVEHARCDAQFRVFDGVVSDDVGFRCCRPSP